MIDNGKCDMTTSNLRDLGYTVYSRYELALRRWLADRLQTVCGNRWQDQIPNGIKTKIIDKLSLTELSPDPMQALDATDIPDLMEIMCYRKSFRTFMPDGAVDAEAYRKDLHLIYQYRCKIAHSDPLFSKADLTHLVVLVEGHLPLLGDHNHELKLLLQHLDDPSVVLRIPIGFAETAEPANNLPSADFEADGGFIGRTEELGKLKRHVLSKLDRVVTVTGAGGVGKTALALRLCQHLLRMNPFPFEAIIWTSAKEERLGLTGIELIDPNLRTFDDLINTILSVCGWTAELERPLPDRIECVYEILKTGDQGILLVIDNLETIHDQRVIEFIKDLPLPNRALLTSRIGLGEIERRYPLAALNQREAVALFKNLARDRGLNDLVAIPDSVIDSYVERLHRYPLAIKWAIGQVSLGKDLNTVIAESASASGDIARFCFEYIFDKFVAPDEKRILYVLSTQDQSTTKGVISHLSGLSLDAVEAAIQRLVTASLVVSQHRADESGLVTASYGLLSLTRTYAYSKLQSEPDVLADIRRRMDQVQATLDLGARAKQEYKYTFRDMDASSEEEKIAATWCLNAYQKYQAGDYASAVRMFGSAANIAPKMPTVYRNWARMEIEAGFYARAKECISKAVDLVPGDVRMWREWGSIEMKAQHYDEAAAKVEHALQIEPDDAQLLNLLGEIEKRRGNHARADALFRRALAAFEGSNETSHVVITKTAMADNLRKWAEALTTSDSETAASYLNQGYRIMTEVASADSSPRSQATLREIAFALGRLCERRGQVAEAIRYYDRSISWDPIRESDKRKAAAAAQYIADHLLRAERREESRKYLDLARAYCRGPEALKQLDGMVTDYETGRRCGILYRVIRGKGYGFLSHEAGSAVFLHHSNVIPPVGIPQFEKLEGQEVSFVVVEREGKQAAVRACTRSSVVASEATAG
jgi:tetratricopeptide (TPR) repeat protein/cold shock CspA family protein